MAALPNKKLSEEAYLAMERAADARHAYLDGDVFAMTGASRTHNLITLSIASELRGRLKPRGCEVYASDMRVHVPETGLYTYPDVSVVCGEPRFLDGELDTLLNPRIIVEVLSPSTEDHDRGLKFLHYRSIESLRDYVLVAQNRIHVEHLRRRRDGRWLLSEHARPADTIAFDDLETSLEIATIYDGVAVDAAHS